MRMVVIQACNFRPLTASLSMLSHAQMLMRSCRAQLTHGRRQIFSTKAIVRHG